MTPAGAALIAQIETYVRNDAVKAFHNLQLNYILKKLTGMADNAVSGVANWGNIAGDINAQTDLIDLIDQATVHVRPTPADLTGSGIEIVPNNGIYNDGTLIIAVTSPFVVALRETDFALDGITGKWTCNKPSVQAIPGGFYLVEINEYNRKIYSDGNITDPDDSANPEWQTVTGGGFQINLPEFDPSTQKYHVYVYPSIL